MALAKAGADVTFVARGAHFAATRISGLKVLGPRGDAHLGPTPTSRPVLARLMSYCSARDDRGVQTDQRANGGAGVLRRIVLKFEKNCGALDITAK
jgi:hypothetical protein